MEARRQLSIDISVLDGAASDDRTISLTVDVSGSQSRLIGMHVDVATDDRWVIEGLRNFDFNAAIGSIVKSFFQSPSDDIIQNVRPHSDRPQTTSVTTKTSGRKKAITAELPPPPDLASMYWKLGSVAKVAKHYEVSTRIANEWIRELRDSNIIPNPWRRR